MRNRARQPALVKRRGDEHSIAPKERQPLDIPHAAYPAPDKKLHCGQRRAQLCNQLPVNAQAGAHAGEIE